MLDLSKVLNKNRIKFLSFIFLILFLSTVAYAMDECSGKIDTDDVPCHVFLPNNETGTPDCDGITISYYFNETFLYSQAMTNFTPFLCNSTFNQTDLGTYTFLFSTGDIGSIILEEGLKMILMLYFVIAMIIAMLGVALWKEDTTLASIGGFLTMILGIWIGIDGFGTLNNLLSNAIAVVFICVGFYIVLKVNLESL